MGRLVVARARPTAGESLSARVAEVMDDAGIAPDAALWTLPVNEHTFVVVLERDGSARPWVAYGVADAVAARPPGTSGHTLPSGESAYAVPFSSPEHHPAGPRGHSLLRVPVANPRADGAALFPGERLALDEWFAIDDPDDAGAPRALAILLRTDAATPARPEYRITTDPRALAEPANRSRVQAIAIFETIADETLDELLRAYLGAG